MAPVGTVNSRFFSFEVPFLPAVGSGDGGDFICAIFWLSPKFNPAPPYYFYGWCLYF